MGVSPGRPICGTPSDRWAGVLGTVGSPGWLEEGRKERSGREVPRGGIYKKISQCQEPS